MKRALVVASETKGLRGANNDARSMADMLWARGFDDVDLRVDRDATRDGILAGYDRLADLSQPGDAAVVYYSGHGFHAVAPGTRHGSWQCIVPTDLHEGAVHDWRGITAWELSIKQAQLTAKTKNVTVILDCCHSAQMSRDAAVRDAIPRALAHPANLGFEAHLDGLRARYGADFEKIGGSGNLDAVRVTACGQLECAYEYCTREGEYRGAFTESLIAVLREVGDARISWATVGDAIRARVLRNFVTQRAEVEGPSRRRLFELDEIELGGVVTLDAAAGELRLPVGRLLGAVVGDTYGVMGVGATVYDGTASRGQIEVTDVRALDSSARVLAWENGHTTFPPDAVAVPLVKQAPKRAVMVDAPPAERALIEQAIRARNTLRVATPDEHDAAVAFLKFEHGALSLEDEKGPLFPPERFPGALKVVIDNVANLGVAEAIRELDGEHGVYTSELAIELGVIDQGRLHRIPDEGAALGLHDLAYLQITNRSKMGRTLYAHVFNLGLRGKISLLTSFAPTGVPLRCGDLPFVLGRGADGQLRGLRLFWPEEMPRASFPRLDEVVVIVTSKPTSLTSLETSEHRSVTRSGSSPLEDKLAQIQDGAGRKNVRFDEDDGYYLKLLSFLLYPRDGAMGGTSFEIDENPLGQAAAREARAWLAPGVDDTAKPAAVVADVPRAIAIRLADLVVEKNRALFAADVRVDALICTRSREHGGSVRAWTQKFSGIRDGERLPLDNALLFHGPVEDFVDIALWVSRDTQGSLDLAKLLARRATSPELVDAAGALAIGTGAVLAPWVAAVGASAVMARMAYELLLGATGSSIGLYRTSYLAGERFGAGRHPSEGLYRAQDCSFSLWIEPV